MKIYLYSITREGEDYFHASYRGDLKAARKVAQELQKGSPKNKVVMEEWTPGGEVIVEFKEIYPNKLKWLQQFRSFLFAF